MRVLSQNEIDAILRNLLPDPSILPDSDKKQETESSASKTVLVETVTK
jgi:hypothetical protein